MATEKYKNKINMQALI